MKRFQFSLASLVWLVVGASLACGLVRFVNQLSEGASLVFLVSGPPWEILIVSIVALLLFGSRLPDIEDELRRSWRRYAMLFRMLHEEQDRRAKELVKKMEPWAKLLLISFLILGSFYLLASLMFG